MTKRAWISYAPALIVTFAGISIAGILGGPIAAAITAFLAIPTLLVASIVTFIVRRKYRPTKTWATVSLGLAIYIAAGVAILVLLNLYGPSQIM